MDTNIRKTSVFGNARCQGLTKGYSVSTPNVASLDVANAVLDRIGDLESQISNQHSRQ